jgi:hypothetical protein
MVTQYDFNPFNLPDELHVAIGLFITCAGQTETFINEAIAGCLGVDMEMGGTVTANLSVKYRMSILKAAAEVRITNLDLLAELDLLILEIEKAFEARNAVAHGRWAREPKSGALGTVVEKAHVTYTRRCRSAR